MNTTSFLEIIFGCTVPSEIKKKNSNLTVTPFFQKGEAGKMPCD